MHYICTFAEVFEHTSVDLSWLLDSPEIPPTNNLEGDVIILHQSLGLFLVTINEFAPQHCVS